MNHDENGRLRLCSRKCDTCIFRPGNPMKLRPGRVKGMIRDALRSDSAIICHSSLADGEHAVCRGFFEKFTTNLLRVMGRLGGIVEVEPKSIHKREGVA